METLSVHSASSDARELTDLPERLRSYPTAVLELQQTGRMLHARGWSVGTSSNYSIIVEREPLQLLVTASGKDKGNLTPDDFVLVDVAGAPVVAEQPKSSAETLLHCLLAKQPNVGAILHTHSVWATVLSGFFAEHGGLAIEDYEMLKGLEGIGTHEHQLWVPIFDNSQDIPALAREVDQRLFSSEQPHPHGFLLRQHGLYTWGQDLFTARRHVEIFEFLFECVARKLMLQNSLQATASFPGSTKPFDGE